LLPISGTNAPTHTHREAGLAAITHVIARHCTALPVDRARASLVKSRRRDDARRSRSCESSDTLVTISSNATDKFEMAEMEIRGTRGQLHATGAANVATMIHLLLPSVLSRPLSAPRVILRGNSWLTLIVS